MQFVFRFRFYAFALCIMLVFRLIYEMKNITSTLTSPGAKAFHQFISVRQLLDSIVFLQEPWHWTIAPLNLPKNNYYLDQLWCLKYFCFITKKGKTQLDANKIIISTNYLGKQKCSVTRIHRETCEKNQTSIMKEISLMPQLHALLWSFGNLWHKLHSRF